MGTYEWNYVCTYLLCAVLASVNVYVHACASICPTMCAYGNIDVYVYLYTYCGLCMYRYTLSNYLSIHRLVGQDWCMRQCMQMGVIMYVCTYVCMHQLTFGYYGMCTAVLCCAVLCCWRNDNATVLYYARNTSDHITSHHVTSHHITSPQFTIVSRAVYVQRCSLQMRH